MPVVPELPAGGAVLDEYKIGSSNVSLTQYPDGQFMLCFGTDRFFKIRAFPAHEDVAAREAYQQTVGLIAYAVIHGTDNLFELLNDSCWHDVRLEFDVDFGKGKL